ncbi:hypothetical protein SDC9_121340 [bioreactor metagenome]|uniref:Uncharacterized protein n=1 Tax=bioreactor metagenome TaxID=1076179 RepID=A0A645CBT9_9ZZZZ
MKFLLLKKKVPNKNGLLVLHLKQASNTQMRIKIFILPFLKQALQVFLMVWEEIRMVKKQPGLLEITVKKKCLPSLTLLRQQLRQELNL